MKGSFVERINHCAATGGVLWSRDLGFDDWTGCVRLKFIPNLKIEAFRLWQFRTGMNMPDRRTIDLCPMTVFQYAASRRSPPTLCRTTYPVENPFLSILILEVRIRCQTHSRRKLGSDHRPSIRLRIMPNLHDFEMAISNERCEAVVRLEKK